MAATGDLMTDRRVQRHADALREAGCEVVTLGRNDLGVKHRRGWMFYAEYNHRLWRRLRGEHADVVWANDADTLPGAWLGSRKGKARLVMDAHELFSEVPEIQHKALVRRVWRTVERTLMPRCDATLTVCQSIADYYGARYGVEMTVVRNVSARPTEGAAHPKVDGDADRMLLYQGCVNLGRGVDWAIDALEWLPDCRLVVAGDGDLLEEMKAYAAAKPWSDRISFTGRLMPDELERLTPQADVGLVMLEDMGVSYHYALPNRIGDFVAAGVPMVVSDLPEMAAVVRMFGVGEVIDRPHGADDRAKAQALAQAVQRVLARQWSADDFAAAREDMDWNKEKQKLTAIVEKTRRRTTSTDIETSKRNKRNNTNTK